ncbi:unnamed protein product [Polarella glacialis]|uniref:Uncharacterized protein n=1 Tax=Polarella glacialis TaxID=89957 RepID=A0A813E6F6_POLGL|nr:unnamed protein product [Polarella glacialis]CAE8720872.1 unnamed protein product [Polarella glacialis]
MSLHDRTNTAIHSLRHPGSRLHQRGVSLATVMDLGGRHFGNSACEKDYDALSFPTDKYGVFISHSWRTSRWAKYAALLYYTSLVPALCAGLAAGILAFALQVLGALPPFGVSQDSIQVSESVPSSLWCLVMGGCTCFAILVMWARLFELAESTRKSSQVSYFLDCLCINQSDAELKQAGIDSIGAYLRNSDSMLVLWSPEYFTRLWCCFELAVFLEKSTNAGLQSLLQNSCAEMRHASVGAMLDLRRKSSPTEINNEETVPARIAVATSAHKTRNETHDRKLMIIPVQMGVFCMACLVMSYVFCVLSRVMEFLDQDLVEPFWALAMFAGCLAIYRFCRRYSQDRLELNKQIAQFTVSRADCNLSQDREFIKAVITCLYSETLNEIDGIAAFEYVLRSRVQHNVDKILGSRLHVPWRLTVAVMFVITLRGLDKVAETFMIPSHLADPRALAGMQARQAATAFAHTCAVPAFLYCAIVTSCFLPERKGKLAELASHAIFVLVTLTFLYVCTVLVSLRIRDMPAPMSVPLNLTFGLILLSGPACCNYVACWFSFRVHGGPSSNQEAGQKASREAKQEPGEHESREETHWDEGDCEHALEPIDPQGPTSMNIMVSLPTADEPSLTMTQEAILLGNVMARHGVADMTTGTVCSIHLAHCCC